MFGVMELFGIMSHADTPHSNTLINSEMSDEKKENDEDPIEMPYFEKQSLEMCLLHSINSLYQYPKYTSKDLDKICTSLAPNKLINPHKSILQTGNYDANVLNVILEQDNIDCQWFDSRKAKQFSLDDEFLCPLNKPQFVEFSGFIINSLKQRMYVFNRRHWFTVKRIDGFWWNLDSNLKEPKLYKTKEQIQELKDWIIDLLQSNDAQLMICRKREETKKNVKNNSIPSQI